MNFFVTYSMLAFNCQSHELKCSYHQMSRTLDQDCPHRLCFATLMMTAPNHGRFALVNKYFRSNRRHALFDHQLEVLSLFVLNPMTLVNVKNYNHYNGLVI